MADPEQVRQARLELGRSLARFRHAAGLKQAALAATVHYTRSTVANVEVGRQNAPLNFWTRCDEVLNAGGALREGYDAICRLLATHRQEQARNAARPASTTTSPADGQSVGTSKEAYRSPSRDIRRAPVGGARHNPEDVVRRRILIQQAVTALAAGAVGPALNAIRHGLVTSVTGREPGDLDVDEWEQIAHDYGAAYFTEQPAVLVHDLAAELADIQSELDMVPDGETSCTRVCPAAPPCSPP